MDDSSRQRMLIDAVNAIAARGGRVEARYPYYAVVMARKGKMSGGWIAVHVILTIVTAGIWGIVWIAHALSLRAQVRYRVSVDMDGRVMQVVQTGAASDSLIN